MVTASHDGRDHGLALSAITSVSLEPPMLLICVNRTSHTSWAIEANGSFCVNILSDRQGTLTSQFATKRTDKFDGLEVDHRNPAGVPVLPGALGWVACRVVDQVLAAAHTIFVAEAVAAFARPGAPLVYFRGGFQQVDRSLTA